MHVLYELVFVYQFHCKIALFENENIEISNLNHKLDYAVSKFKVSFRCYSVDNK